MAINIGDYKTKARESGIMVGDYVQITRKAEYGENGWRAIGLIPIVDKTIGEIGQVIRITNNWDFSVYFKDIERWYFYPYFVLRRVHRSPIVPRFNIGDQVLIKRAWVKGELGTYIGFDERSMTETIGKIGKIVEICLHNITHEIYYYVDTDMSNYAYPEFVLRKFDKPNPDFEFEPFDTLLHITGPTLSR